MIIEKQIQFCASFEKYAWSSCNGCHWVIYWNLDDKVSQMALMKPNRKQRSTPDSKVHAANMGPIWVLSAPDGPRVDPMTHAIRDSFTVISVILLLWTDDLMFMYFSVFLYCSTTFYFYVCLCWQLTETNYVRLFKLFLFSSFIWFFCMFKLKTNQYQCLFV